MTYEHGRLSAAIALPWLGKEALWRRLADGLASDCSGVQGRFWCGFADYLVSEG